MAKNLTPAQLAAANGSRSDSTRLLDQLAGRVQTKMTEYTGASALSIRISAEEAGVVDQLGERFSGWHFYASPGGSLYFGNKGQVGAIRIREAGEAIPNQPIHLIKSVPPTPTPSVPPRLRPSARDDRPVVLAGNTSPTSVSVQPGQATSGKHTVQLGTVKAESTRLQVTDAAGIFAKQLGYPVEACGVKGQLVKPLGFHGLIETAHQAFAYHLGLELTPDVVWVAIMQGLARVIAREPERFRSTFVLHDDRQVIEVVRNEFRRGSPDNDWAGCFGEFSTAIGKSIGADNHRRLVGNFSTTGPLERAVGDVALMDMMQSYFEYKVYSMCGIPFVNLRGTSEDWRQLVGKTRDLLSLGALDWWLNDVVGILEKIVDTLEGNVDRDFWNSVYKSHANSGNDTLTGWLVKFLPIIKDLRTDKPVVNPMLGKDLPSPHVYDREDRKNDWGRYNDFYVRMWEDERAGLVITTKELPPALSSVPFVWDYFGNKLNYRLVAGFVGYSQNADDHALVPQLGWAVLPEPTGKPNFKD